MQFKLSTLVGLLAVASPAFAVDVASTYDGYTALTQDVDKTVQSVTLVNVFQTGPQVIQGYHSLVKSENQGYQNNQGAQALPSSQQQAACNSFTNFASVLTTALQDTISKHQIIEIAGLSYQMTTVLRGVEGVTDENAYTLIKDQAPNCGASLQGTKDSLDKALVKAIRTYSDGLP